MDEPPEAFREGLASLSPERFAAFVADLWEARGRTVTREDALLRVREPTGETAVLHPVAAGASASVPARVDVAVAATGPPPSVPAGVEVVGPAGLYRRVRYGVDGPTGDRLLATYVDADLAGSSGGSAPPSGDRTRSAGATAAAGGTDTLDPGEAGATRSTERRPTSAGVGWGRRGSTRRAILVAGGAFAAGLGTALAVLSGRDDRPDAVADAAAGSTESPADRATRPAPLAPGLTERGVVDPRTLAISHVGRLQDTSYAVRAAKAIHDDRGRLRSSWSIRVAVDGSRAFRARVATEGPAAPPLVGDPPVSAVVWSDRETYLRRVTTTGGTYYVEVPPRIQVNDWYYWSNVVPVGGFPYATHEFYQDLFEAVPTGVDPASEDDPATDRVVAETTGLDPPPPFMGALDGDVPVSDLDLLARVRETGLVSSLLLGYRGSLGGRPADVQWSIAYDGLGETTVGRPAWYERARGNRSIERRPDATRT